MEFIVLEGSGTVNTKDFELKWKSRLGFNIALCLNLSVKKRESTFMMFTHPAVIKETKTDSVVCIPAG